MNKQNMKRENSRQALERIEKGENTANHQTIIDEFSKRGIPLDEIQPRENVFTYHAWQAKGRQVMKRPPHIPSGQYGVKIPVVFEKVDPETKKVIKRFTKQVNDILHSWNYQDTPERTELLRMMDTPPVFIDPVALKIREAEEALFGQKIPGFFPTPRDLADRMVQLAQLGNDQEVLEPSAGKGDVAEAILRHCSQAEIEVDLTCIETNHQLCQILELKGFQYAQADFQDVGGTVDRIIMNPPFENSTDIRHVLHAYDLLSPGGILVALLSGGVISETSGNKHKENFRVTMRNWSESNQLFVSELIRDAFKGPQAFNQTGVTCLLIAVRKGDQQ
jgi:predicted RNA methylase